MAKHVINYVLLILLVIGVPSFANVMPKINKDIARAPVTPVNLPKLEFIQNYVGSNEIKILNNRFRVDYHVDELLLLFFRQPGSKPIVLVKPDGSKIYSRHSNGRAIEWHADKSFDLIRLQSPMPGPWQAVGRISENSKILLLSNIELEADPFPKMIFQHEVIKSEARVIAGSEVVKAKNFNEVIRMRANFYPSNNPSKDNFGADIYQFGEFLDNGKGLDERPRDGVFTIRYKIDISKGEWIPNYRIDAKLFTRELVQDPVLVIPSPVSFTAIPATLTETGEVGRYHYVTFDVDDTHLDNLSLLFQGTIQFPNGEKQNFTVDGIQDRRLEIFNSEYGPYNIDMDMFGMTKDGREIHLDLPTFQFITTESDLVAAEVDFPEMPEMTELPEMTEMEDDIIMSEDKELPLLLILVINFFVLLIGFALIWVYVMKREIKNPFANLPKFNFNFKKKKKETPEPEPEKAETVKPEVPKEKAPDLDSPDDILDLSLPED